MIINVRRWAVGLAAAAACATSAHAQLTFADSGSAWLTERFDAAGIEMPVGSSIRLGELVSSSSVVLGFTNLGAEAALANALVVGGDQVLKASSPVGTRIDVAVGAGSVDLRFVDGQGAQAVNTGQAWSDGTSIALIGRDMEVGGIVYQFVLGFNDSIAPTALADWDDQVVGISVLQVPEPSRWAALLAGLALVGIARRRRR